MLEHVVTLQYIERAQSGDIDAKAVLIEDNLPLVKSIVKRYIGKLVEYDDLMQLGSIGLLKAINNFDSRFEVRFSTYAVPMIAGEIKRFMRDDGAIKVSRAIKSQYIKITAFIEVYKNQHHKEPSIEDISKELEIPEIDVVFALDSSKYPISLYEKYSDDNDTMLIDKVPSKENECELVDRLLLKEIISQLPLREQKIIMLRYFRDKTQSEIALELGVSQVQVSRLETKILEKLKEHFEAT